MFKKLFTVISILCVGIPLLAFDSSFSPKVLRWGHDAEIKDLNVTGTLTNPFINQNVTDTGTPTFGEITISTINTPSGTSSVVITTKTVITNDYLHIGTGGTVNYVDGDGDLYIKDELEVDGIIYSETANMLSDYGSFQLGSTRKYKLRTHPTYMNGIQLLLASTSCKFAICNIDHQSKDYDWDVNPDNPTLRIYSVQNPDIDNTQWFSMSYSSDTDRAEIDTGGGEIYIKKPIVLDDLLQLKSHTTAELNAITPTAISQVYWNSDTSEFYISTGTAINDFIHK